jgi:hypothetical protein
LASDRERLRRLLEVKDDWILAALYSDPEISRINEELVVRWERAGMKGDPLDYATEDEIRKLLLAARRYIFLKPEEARAIALSRMTSNIAEPSSFESESRRRGLLARISERLKRAFSGGA